MGVGTAHKSVVMIFARSVSQENLVRVEVRRKVVGTQRKLRVSNRSGFNLFN